MKTSCDRKTSDVGGVQRSGNFVDIDSTLAQQLFLTLKTLKEQGITIVLVEQNVHLVLAVSDYTYVLAEGRVPIEGNLRKWQAWTKSGAPTSACRTHRLGNYLRPI